MAMTYSGLTAAKTVSTSVAYWVNYALLPVDQLLTDAQAFIYQQMRVREMRASAPLSIAQYDSSVALPADFLDPIGLLDERRDAIRQIDELSLERMRVISSGQISTGEIQQYAIYDEAFNFDVRATAATTLRLLYYKKPADLGPSNETNFLTTRYPHILRAAVLAEAFEFRQDDGAANKWRTKAVGFIEAANQQDDLSRRGADYPVEITDHG